ncbi:glycosyltransferase [Lysobacter humi (ex Lee et al. 2017)]
MDSQNSSVVLFHVDETGVLTRGWAFDARQAGPARIALWIDGVERCQFVADEFRPDLQKLGYRDGFCGFRFVIPAALCDGHEHDVMLTLGTENRPMLPGTLRVRLDAAEFREPIEGSLDAIDERFHVTGWVGGDRAGREVGIYLGEERIASGTADLPRPDLVLAEKTGYGFRIKIDPERLTTAETTLVAYCEEELLSGSVVVDAEKRAVLTAEPTYDGRMRVTLSGWPVESARLDILVDGEFHSPLTLRKGLPTGVGAHDQTLVGYWDASGELLDARRHVVQVRGTGALASLATDPLFVRWPDYRVNIDRVDDRAIAGWAIRLAQPRSLRLEVRAAGMAPVEVYANQRRTDVAQALGLPNDLVGFHVNFGASLDGRHIEIVDADTGTVLVVVRLDDPSAALVALSQSAFSAESSGDPGPRRLISAARALLPVEPIVSVDYLPDRSGEADGIGVDVIVPVYSGASETVECIESVLASRNESDYRLILVNDRSPDTRITEYLRRIASRHAGRVILIERQRNGGFSEAVNIGMTVAGRRDVILLNADTVVQGDWVDRILGVAAKDLTIGTVTPFSNNGEVCSLPYLCKSLAVEERSQLVSLDRHAASGSGEPIDLPVAVGYCMYIRRACIDELGLFDAKTWGRGYGEEVDFCLKASARGWRHVLAPNVFVVHRGGVSFGDEKLVRIQESSRKIAERYPFYDRLIQVFLRKDPPARARRQVNLAVLGERLPCPRVLHITHDFGGGTERYVRDLARLYENEGHVNAVLSFGAEGQAVLRLDTQRARMPGLFMARHDEAYDVDEVTTLVDQLDALAFERVHLHAPFGVPDALMQWVVRQPHFDATIHDYAWICPRVTLRDRAGRPCDADGVLCSQCAAYDEAHPGLRAVLRAAGHDIRRYREYFAWVLGQAERVFAGGHDVVGRMRNAGIDAAFRVVAHPYPEQVASRRRARAAPPAGTGPYRVALIGGISEIKGYSRLVECAREGLRLRSPLEFIVFGETEDNAGLAGYSNVKILGRYTDDALHDLLDSRMPDVALFLNQVPETFSYTLTSAFEHGLWPVVTDLGVPAERVRNAGFGDVVPVDIPAEELLGRLQQIIRERRASVSEIPEFDRPRTLKEYRGQ